MDEWLTFAFLAKRVFVQKHLYENACHLYIYSLENQVIFMWNVLHEHSFEREATQKSNSEVEVKSAYEPSGPLGWHLFPFL